MCVDDWNTTPSITWDRLSLITQTWLFGEEIPSLFMLLIMAKFLRELHSFVKSKGYSLVKMTPSELLNLLQQTCLSTHLHAWMQTPTKTKQRVSPAGPNDSDESILCVRFVLMTSASVPGLGGCLCVLLITWPLQADWVICWFGHLPCVRLLNKTLSLRSHLRSRALGYERWQERKKRQKLMHLEVQLSCYFFIVLRSSPFQWPSVSKSPFSGFLYQGSKARV